MWGRGLWRGRGTSEEGERFLKKEWGIDTKQNTLNTHMKLSRNKCNQFLK